MLGATDRRLRAVVAQVPTISGYQQSLRRVAPDRVAALEASFVEDDPRQFAGEAPEPSRSSVPTHRRLLHITHLTRWRFLTNQCPKGCTGKPESRALQSRRAHVRTWAMGFAGVAHAAAEIIGLNDTINLADTGLAAYERALQPKKLVTIPGGHFDAYLSGFEQSSAAARDWFVEHLAGKE